MYTYFDNILEKIKINNKIHISYNIILYTIILYKIISLLYG